MKYRKANALLHKCGKRVAMIEKSPYEFPGFPAYEEGENKRWIKFLEGEWRRLRKLKRGKRVA